MKPQLSKNTEARRFQADYSLQMFVVGPETQSASEAVLLNDTESKW